MNVGRAIWMTSEGSEKFTDRTIGGNRIAHRRDRVETVPSLLVGTEGGAQMAGGLRAVLHVVHAVDCRLPHFNFCSGKRRAILAEDHAFKSERLAWLRTPKNGA